MDYCTLIQHTRFCRWLRWIMSLTLFIASVFPTNLVISSFSLLGSFSKIFSPGFRTGWVHCKGDLNHQLVSMFADTSLSSLLLCWSFRLCINRKWWGILCFRIFHFIADIARRQICSSSFASNSILWKQCNGNVQWIEKLVSNWRSSVF
jgi:hypothetical protein